MVIDWGVVIPLLASVAALLTAWNGRRSATNQIDDQNKIIERLRERIAELEAGREARIATIEAQARTIAELQQTVAKLQDEYARTVNRFRSDQAEIAARMRHTEEENQRLTRRVQHLELAMRAAGVPVPPEEG